MRNVIRRLLEALGIEFDRLDKSLEPDKLKGRTGAGQRGKKKLVEKAEKGSRKSPFWPTR